MTWTKEQIELAENFLDKWIQEMKEKDRKKKEYIISEDFVEDTRSITEYLQTHDCLDEEHLRYFPDDGPVSGKKLIFYIESVKLLHEEENGEFFNEDDNPFANAEWERYGLVFRIMCGQGTCMQIWNKEEYEKFREEIKKGPGRSE